VRDLDLNHKDPSVAEAHYSNTARMEKQIRDALQMWRIACGGSRGRLPRQPMSFQCRSVLNVWYRKTLTRVHLIALLTTHL
jgi:hypothetical protein